MTDEQALESINLYLPWREDTSYVVGDKRRDGGKLWECLQAHTSQSNWHPADTPALWKEISVEEWPEWVQPAGAHDAYQTGDKVTHKNRHWVSDVDNNTWEPGVYGWSETA